jgi:hypothetical protein
MTHSFIPRTLSICLVLFGCLAVLPAEDAPAIEAAKTADGVTAYPLDYCATCGPEEKGEHLVSKTHKGREIKMCKGCVKIFNADPEGYVKKVDKAIKDAEKTKEAAPAVK